MQGESRYDIERPFVVGGWKYASNGFIAVRRRTVKPDMEVKVPPELFSTFDAVDWSTCIRQLPQVHPDRYEWDDTCDCAEFCSEPADVCDGLGSNCKRCGGRGVILKPDCPVCKGTGTVHYSDPPIMRFDGMLVDGKYLEMVHKDLPGPALYAPQALETQPLPVLCGPYQVLIAQLKREGYHWRPIRDAEAMMLKEER
jgi:hypothetical protein